MPLPSWGPLSREGSPRVRFDSISCFFFNIFPGVLDAAGQGYWCMFPASCLYGKFICLHPSHGQGHEWTSRQIHVDIKVICILATISPTVDQFRYNFEAHHGEIKVAKEWRQRCSSNQERENHDWVFPLLEDGQVTRCYGYLDMGYR